MELLQSQEFSSKRFNLVVGQSQAGDLKIKTLFNDDFDDQSISFTVKIVMHLPVQKINLKAKICCFLLMPVQCFSMHLPVNSFVWPRPACRSSPG